MNKFRRATCINDNYMNHHVTLGNIYEVRDIPNDADYMLPYPLDFYEIIDDKNIVTVILRHRFEEFKNINLSKHLLL